MFIFIFLFILVNVNSFDMPANKFDYLGHYTLGKQLELNRTFTKLGQKIQTLDDIVWIVNDSATYTISQTKMSFYYRDSKQEAKITGNDTILISGGSVEVDLKFNWNRDGSVKTGGPAQAEIVSDVISFVKQVILDNNFVEYQLFDYDNVTFSSDISLTRIDPSTITAEDQRQVLALMNTAISTLTLKSQLQRAIAISYDYYLRNCLHDERDPITDHFTYQWTHPTTQQNISILYDRQPHFIDVEQSGISLTFLNKIKDYTDWKNGSQISHHPYNPTVYGGSQQFYTIDFIQNNIRYAIKMGYLNTILDRINWQSRFFQFYVGDLYEVIPKLTTIFPPKTKVDGSCNASSQDLNLTKNTQKTFNVTFQNKCQLIVNDIQIALFAVKLECSIIGLPESRSINFKVQSFSDTPQFSTSKDGYKIENQDLATTMIRHSLNRLVQNNIFGSNFSLLPRDYPTFMVEIDCVGVIDSSHVNTKQIS